MLTTVDQDLDSHIRTPLDPARAIYDTPFFDGNSRSEQSRTDQIVCVESKCSQQSAVNYVAQGMYGAKTGEAKWFGGFVMNVWNLRYGHLANDDEWYWYNYGYDYEQRKKQNTQTNQEPQ
jgi:hypothetical protein